MALSRNRRFEPNIWPGFVDAMTALVMVVMFVLTIVIVVQSVMREQLTTQEGELDSLGERVSGLNLALGAADAAQAALTDELGTARQGLATRSAEIARLSQVLALRDDALGEATSRLTDREAEVAALLAAQATERAAAQAATRALTTRAEQAEGRVSAAELAVASARQEVDEAAARARLDAARADALEAMVADLRVKDEGAGSALSEAQAKLSQAETARLTDAAAAEALRAKLDGAEAELAAMTLALEESRKRAEDTLTLLAAADAAKKDVAAGAEAQLTEAERNAALLNVAQAKLSEQEALSAEDARKVALLNAQVADLSGRLASLQDVLDAQDATGGEVDLKIANLGERLNAALLKAAEAEKARAALEAEKRSAAEAEAQDLTRYRSEFFGRLSQILAGREGVKVVGDRFVFSSDVVFPAAGATLSPEGRAQIDSVAAQLKEIAGEIPEGIDWILRVDGHTDAVPLSGGGRFGDNWELSQARALAVVRYLVDRHGFPPERLAAAGFGEYRPAVDGDSPEARAQNRRIELKLTER